MNEEELLKWLSGRVAHQLAQADMALSKGNMNGYAVYQTKASCYISIINKILGSRPPVLSATQPSSAPSA